MRTPLIGLTGLIGLTVLPAPALAAGDAYLTFHSLTHSDPVSIKAFIEDWEDDFEGGDKAFTHNRAELGVNLGRWRVGLVYRYDYLLDFSEDSAELYYRSRTEQGIPEGESYRVDIEAVHAITRGLKLGYRFEPAATLGVEVGLNLLQGQDLTDGRLRGRFTALDQDSYDAYLDVDYRYQEDQLFDRPTTWDDPEAWGYSLDVALAWQPRDDLTVSLQVYDLLGYLYWDDAPFTDARATSDVERFDEAGNIRIEPTLEGVEGNEDFRQRLPIHGWLRGDYQFAGKWHLTGEVFANTTGFFPRLGVGRDLPGGQRLDLSYDLEASALGLSYAWQPYLQLSLLADDTDWEQAHTLGVGLELRIPW